MGSTRRRPEVFGAASSLGGPSSGQRGHVFTLNITVDGERADGIETLAWRGLEDGYSGRMVSRAGEAAGGMDYTAVAMAVKRLEQRAARANLQGCNCQGTGTTDHC